MVELNIDCLGKYSKVIHIIGACLLVVLAIAKWASLSYTRMEFIMAFYHIFLAFIIIVSEFPFKCFKCMLVYFGYMRYNFGKAGSCFFLVGLTLGTPILNIIVCSFFALAGIIFLILGCSCKKKQDSNSGAPKSLPLESPTSNQPVKVSLNEEANKLAAKEIANKK